MGFEDSSNSICRFGSKLSPAVLVNSDGNRAFTCKAPPVSNPGPVRVSLGHGSSFFAVPGQFYYYSHLAVQNIVPAMGPTIGSTRVNVTFTVDQQCRNVRCKFGNSVTSALGHPLAIGIQPNGVHTHTVACRSARFAYEGTVDVSVSCDGQTFSQGQNYTYLNSPVLRTVSNTLVEPGTALNITANNLNSGADYKCKIGGQLVQALRLDADVLQCLAPAISTTASRFTTVSLSSDGGLTFSKQTLKIQYTSALKVIHITAPPSVVEGNEIIVHLNDVSLLHQRGACSTRQVCLFQALHAPRKLFL